MMKQMLVISALVAFAAADVKHLFGSLAHHSASAGSDAAAEVLRADSNISPDGSYQYGYETQNGIAAQVQGQLKQVGAEFGNVAQGSFSFTSAEGVPVSVQYVADENGFQPQSDVLPTPHPVPQAILRSLEYNAAHPQPEEGVKTFQRQNVFQRF
ncbi:larval cuticle protein LCP-17-like [Anthonomus grandis grandis]|uniref:larval cuticle protein LCP-17-like n=1 Tax=Anthonomus grandis grandis TaxID=2921223 RepID=UPI002165D784|nr:larval cuticle protein LCP-17-like [Anthonomus grandis grandis]